MYISFGTQFVFKIICINASTIVRTRSFFLSFNPENRVGKGLQMLFLSLSLSFFFFSLDAEVNSGACFPQLGVTLVGLMCGLGSVCAQIQLFMVWLCRTRAFAQRRMSSSITESFRDCSWMKIHLFNRKEIKTRDLIYTSVNCAQEVLSVKKKWLCNQTIKDK